MLPAVETDMFGDFLVTVSMIFVNEASDATVKEIEFMVKLALLFPLWLRVTLPMAFPIGLFPVMYLSTFVKDLPPIRQ